MRKDTALDQRKTVIDLGGTLEGVRDKADLRARTHVALAHIAARARICVFLILEDKVLALPI